MNGNIIRQSPVPGILQHFQVIFLLQMDIGILPQGMDTGIGPPGTDHLPLGPGNPLQRVLQFPLDRVLRPRLPLPAFIAASIIGNNKSVIHDGPSFFLLYCLL